MLVTYLEHNVQSQPVGDALTQKLSDGSVRLLAFDDLIRMMFDEAAAADENARLDPDRPRPEPQLHRAYSA